MIKKIFNFKDKPLVNITLDNIQNRMYEIGFNKEFVEEIMIILVKRFNKSGKKEFQEWFNGLHYRIPDEFNDELLAIKIYEKHSLLIEEQIKELEKETKLSWEIQTEELKNINEKARKVQLVIRDRLSGIALDLLN
ncbi:hypothetical protein [Oceanobacillus chungangensis]|uniref:Uncharacterized protein n=1 Tax=Oceanobacillus chungangensis TaxID=1229152 RepID=A0A3D8PMX5_9BACI|nr:hypothetical protein [Oceanobacillus chungangensis]RDW17456.1 hypothetical protein CWR45_12105 [Oceanobacillus chungangensis]